MRIVTGTVVAILLVLAAPALGDEMADLKAARARLEAAFVNQDADTILGLMTPDHIAVTAVFGGMLTRDEQVAVLPELKVGFSNVTEPRITVFGDEAAYVTYEQSLTGTYRGKPLPARVFAAEVWVTVDGKWLEKSYQETVIDSR